MATSALVGRRVKRKEDPRLITGGATYVDDIRHPDMVYMAVLRSPHAHARLKGLDVEEARRRPEVLMALTGEEVKELYGPLPALSPPGMKVPPRYPLAVGKVRHVGEPVAAVVATGRYQAKDALESISLDLEPLPAVVEPEAALEKEAPVIHEDLGDNLALRLTRQAGDVEQAFREADVVVRGRFENQRLIPSPLEPRGVVAHYQPGQGTLTLWSSTQVPHLLRSYLAGALGLPENRVRVIAPEVGGAFGSKSGVSAEEALAALFSMRLGRPVKWVEERSESFSATTHGRGQVHWVEAAVRKNGQVLGLRYRILVDLGAYLHMFSFLGGLNAINHSLGCYQIPAVEIDLTYVFTNKTPIAPYRGNGRPEGIYSLERMMDLVAAELGMDPAEVRRRNFIPKDAFPYTTPLGVQYDTGDYQATLDKALEMVDYRALRQEQRRLREEGKYLGIGISCYVEAAASGPPSPFLSGWESARVKVEPTGRVTVYTGSSPHGQGDETPFAQIAAQALGLSLEDVAVIHGDTDMVPQGVGSFGSRSLVVGGSAIFQAVEKIKEKASRIAAHYLGLPLEEIRFQEGRFVALKDQEKSLSLKEVAKMAYEARHLPPEMEPGLDVTTFYQPRALTFPFGTHVAVVEVDPESGEVQVKRFVAVEDCGTVINPMLVEGQIHGGVAQGIGQALWEGVIYDSQGQLLTGSFLDYALPNAQMLPELETGHTVTPTPVNPLGAKGVGEAGAIGAPPAIVNAVVDALAPLGIQHLDMPLTPEKVWHAIKGRA